MDREGAWISSEGREGCLKDEITMTDALSRVNGSERGERDRGATDRARTVVLQ